MEMVHIPPLLSNLNVLIAFSKGMWAVKLCSNKILQFLTGVQVVVYNGCEPVIVITKDLTTF